MRVVVPAHPGWFVCEFIPSDEDHKPEFSYNPVIAWEIKYNDVEDERYAVRDVV
jgi:hypothetical protein